MRYLLVCAAALFVVALPSFLKADQSQFDGTWNVTLTCPSNTESSGALGYTYDSSPRLKMACLLDSLELRANLLQSVL
jgi:hypothetical protein